MIDHPPHLEASWYGPLCKYIGSQLDDQTLLKPQGPLRDRDADQSGDPDSSTDSAASYGPFRAEGPKKFPDFILCRFTASQSQDTLKAIIEAKHPGDIRSAIRDLGIYLDLHADPNVVGIAIAGNEVVAVRLDPTSVSGCSQVWGTNLLGRGFLNHIFNLARE